jgi:hypothetical protein
MRVPLAIASIVVVPVSVVVAPGLATVALVVARSTLRPAGADRGGHSSGHERCRKHRGAQFQEYVIVVHWRKSSSVNRWYSLSVAGC